MLVIRTYILLILLLVLGCNNLISDSVNYDHCDELSTYFEECEEIESNCENVNGTYTEDINNDEDAPGMDDHSNIYCCCEY